MIPPKPAATKGRHNWLFVLLAPGFAIGACGGSEEPKMESGVKCFGVPPSCESACGAKDIVPATCAGVGKSGADIWECPPDRPKRVGIECPSCDGCPTGSTCDFANQVCGSNDGSCATPESFCKTWAKISGPVCGCDGEVYPSACAAIQAGTVLNRTGCSPPTPDLFPCGYMYCKRNSEFCRVGFGDTDDRHYECVAVPASCSILDCACVSEDCVGTPWKCMELGNGAVQVDCTLS